MLYSKLSQKVELYITKSRPEITVRKHSLITLSNCFESEISDEIEALNVQSELQSTKNVIHMLAYIKVRVRLKIHTLNFTMYAWSSDFVTGSYFQSITTSVIKLYSRTVTSGIDFIM